MLKAKILLLRRYDVETETYFTYYVHSGKRSGCFHRTPKLDFKDDTSIKTTKGLLYEIRILGNHHWKNIGAGEFQLRLTALNAVRKERGWASINPIS